MKESVQNKKIGLVLSSAPGYSETFFRNKINGLQKYGHEVILFLDDPPKNGQKPPCKYFVNINLQENSFKKSFGIFKIIFRTIFFHFGASCRHFKLDRADGLSVRHSLKSIILNEYLLNEPLDWLHFGFGMLTYSRENVAKTIGARMAVSFRGFDLYLSPLKHPGCYDQLFKKKIKYHVLSNYMKSRLRNQHGVLDNIEVITPAISKNFSVKYSDLDSSSIVQFITVARLDWIKGLEYTLESLSILNKRGVKFNYKIIGAGNDRERLIFAAHQLNISEYVTFLGKTDQNEIKNQLGLSHIYLQYSIQEGFCNSTLEAQSVGLLCIVSDAEGLRENVVHGETGWVVQKRQPRKLAQKIIDVINLSSEEKEAIRNKAINRVDKRFRLDQQNLAFNLFYD